MQTTAPYAPEAPSPREPLRTWGLRRSSVPDAPRAAQSLRSILRAHDLYSGLALALVVIFLLWIAIFLTGISTEIPAVPTPAVTAQPVRP